MSKFLQDDADADDDDRAMFKFFENSRAKNERVASPECKYLETGSNRC